MRVKRSVENLGLDLARLKSEDLEELAVVITEAIEKTLNQILGPRILKVFYTVSVEFEGGSIVVDIDIEVDSKAISGVFLESVIDKALKSGFDAARLFLKERFGQHS